MARKSTQQEIVLVTKSRFAGRQYCEKDSSESAKNISQQEQFKEACWNGILKDILPELFFMSGPDAKLYLWQMRECQHILALEMAERPATIDLYSSIDPYCFLEVQGYN